MGCLSPNSPIWPPSPAGSNGRRGGAPMEKQDWAARRIDTCSSPDAGGPAAPQATGRRDDVLPIREAVRTWAVEALAAAYGGDTYRLLTDLADLLEASISYVDRSTVETHLERPLFDGEWSAVAACFTAM